jgi:hypothetical protein
VLTGETVAQILMKPQTANEYTTGAAHATVLAPLIPIDQAFAVKGHPHTNG